MLRRGKDFNKFKLRAIDGEIGKAREFYFDDEKWTVRYLVVDTGGWLTGRQVLISPYGLGRANESEHVFPVALTKKQMEESPLLSSHEPVSRQFERQYHGYYGWPIYWGGQDMWGPSAYPVCPLGGWPAPPSEAARRREDDDPHLRSTRAVNGYHIAALDGEIGHVEDFIIDDETWAIRYLVVDTKNWWPGRRVLVSPEWIERVSWPESKVFVSLARKVIKRSPEYTIASLNRDYEAALHGHYGRQIYWPHELSGKSQRIDGGKEMNTMTEKHRSQTQTQIGHDEIAQRAFRLWEISGRPTGRDSEFWLQAEAELCSARNRTRKTLPRPKSV